MRVCFHYHFPIVLSEKSPYIIFNLHFMGGNKRKCWHLVEGNRSTKHSSVIQANINIWTLPHFFDHAGHFSYKATQRSGNAPKEEPLNSTAYDKGIMGITLKSSKEHGPVVSHSLFKFWSMIHEEETKDVKRFQKQKPVVCAVFLSFLVAEKKKDEGGDGEIKRGR